MDNIQLDHLWVLVSAGLVFLMQAGFLCLETGFTRTKNNINVAIKNIVDFGITTLLFWVFGFALMFGPTIGGWIGGAGGVGFAPEFTPGASDMQTGVIVFLIFQVMFCGTAVTILSGSIAERLNFGSYVIITFLISGLVYPVFGHWAWNGIETGTLTGWLGSLGFVDFAGSSVVHSVGGWASLAILLIVGPRLGRFAADGTVRKIPGSNVPIAAFGVLLLWVGWFGFNGGSTLEMNNDVIHIIANTVIAGAAGMTAAMSLSWMRDGKPEVDMVMNGILAGLVAITANCHAVSTAESIIIGGVGGLVMFGLSHLLLRFRIDDAVGAIPVHLGAGIWGTLAVGLFANPEFLGVAPEAFNRLNLIGVQALGVVVCGVWTFGVTYIVMRFIDRIWRLRVSAEDEHIGLNVSEHGARTDMLDLFEVLDEQQQTGNLSLRAPVEPFTEVGQIASRYNRVMDALEQAVARTEGIVRSAMDGIITFSQGTLQINTLNPAAAAIFGYSPGQLSGQPVVQLIAPSPLAGEDLSVDEVQTLLALLAADNAPRELLGRRADGSVFPMEVAVTEAKTAGETFYTGTFRDITERKEAEAALRESEINLSALIENTPDAIWSVDARKRVIIFNSNFYETFRAAYGYDLYVGASIMEMLPDFLRDEWQARYDRALHGERFSVEDHFELPQGDFDYEVSYNPIRNREGKVTGVACVSREITERKVFERDLQTAKEAAEMANRAKSAFLANMSHELRTPLNAIIGYSEMLEEDAADFGYENMVPDLNKIQSAGNHLLDLINNILDLSKIEAGRMELYLETFDAFDMLEDVIVTVQPLVEKNGNRFQIEFDNDLGEMTADVTKVRQTLLNLLSNAAKFTDKGTVTLRAERTAQEGEDWLIFRVIDTGIGMTREQMASVFAEFIQADASTTRKYGGTGLGLTISRRFCQMMGGDITVDSQVGAGTVFTVVLPANVREAQFDFVNQSVPEISTAARVIEAAHKVGIVLVIDDDPAVRDLVARSLVKEGFAVETASNGEEGLRKVRDLRPDAITLDVMMEQVDGWTVLSTIKDDPELSDIPVIMVTIVDDRNKGFALGAADYLTKPIDRKRLVNLISRYRRDAGRSGEDDDAGRVLVVEDNPATREVIVRTLEKEGWTLDEAEHGLDGLARVAAVQPDLILLDLMMPEMDGFEFLVALRHNPRWTQIPVVIVTAKDLTDEDRQVLNGSVQGILTKSAPRLDDLLYEINQMVNTHLSRRGATQGTGGAQDD